MDPPGDFTALRSVISRPAATLSDANEGEAVPMMSAVQTTAADPHNFMRIQRARIVSDPTRRIPSAASKFCN